MSNCCAGILEKTGWCHNSPTRYIQSSNSDW